MCAQLKETQFIKDNFLPATLLACRGFFFKVYPNSSVDSVATMVLNIWRDSFHFLEANVGYAFSSKCESGQ